MKLLQRCFPNGIFTDLDRFELGLQAAEYERAQGLDLQEFFVSLVSFPDPEGSCRSQDSTQPKIENEEVKSWSETLMLARQAESRQRRGLIRGQSYENN